MERHRWIPNAHRRGNGPSLLEEKHPELLITLLQGPCLIEWIPGLEVGTQMPSIRSPQSRTYTSIAYDASSGLIVASSLLNNPFTIFDEEGVQMWEVDGKLSLFPSDCEDSYVSSTKYQLSTVWDVDAWAFPLWFLLHFWRVSNLRILYLTSYWYLPQLRVHAEWDGHSLGLYNSRNAEHRVWQQGVCCRWYHNQPRWRPCC